MALLQVSSLESHAASTGLCIGDLIVEINDTPVCGCGHLVVLGLIKNSTSAVKVCAHCPRFQERE
jgi:hypothetical protein